MQPKALPRPLGGRPGVLRTRPLRWGVSSSTLRRVLSLVLVAVVWEIAGQLKIDASFPALSTAVGAWFNLIISGRLTRELMTTFLTFAAGLAIALVLGFAIGVLVGRYRWAERLLGPYIYAFMAAPTLVYVPVLVIWFGTEVASRIALVVAFAIFPIILNTIAGVRHSDANLVEMARSFQATPQQVIFKVLVPNAVPLVMAGIRVGAGRAVKGVITAEVFLTIVGLGGLIQSFGSSYRTDLLLATVGTVVVFGLVVTEVVKWIDRRLTRWSVGVSRG